MSNQSVPSGTSLESVSELLGEDITPLSVVLVVRCIESIVLAMTVRAIEVFEWKLASGQGVLCERVGKRVSLMFFPSTKHRSAYLRYRDGRPYSGELLSYTAVTDVPRSYMKPRWRRMLERTGLSRSVDIQRFGAHGRAETVTEGAAREIVRNAMETLTSLERIRVREVVDEIPESAADAA